MARFLNPALLAQISNHLVAQMGLHFPEARWNDLERGLVAAARAFNFQDVQLYACWLLSAPLTQEQIEGLACHLTVGETYFFRDKMVFEALRGQILPELIDRRRNGVRYLRIWSAGCCTGEEAYSIAILLRQLLPDWKEWLLTILATDLNPHFLHKAVAGDYGEWSFRDVPLHIKERYFTHATPRRVEILPAIKQQVKFSYLNLVDDIYPSSANNTNAMDIIFCRNVLMYFSPEQAKRVVRKLYDSLVEGGWLVVSPGESSQALFSEFTMVQFPNAILYQKKSQKSCLKNTQDGHQKRRESAAWGIAHEIAGDIPGARTHIAPTWQATGALYATDKAPQPQRLTPGERVAPSPSLADCKALYEQGHYTLAEAQARVLLLEHPHDVVALGVMARIFANQGRLDEALVWCERSIAANRLHAGGYYLFAIIQEERGEMAEAIKALRRALYLEPDFVLAHFALGSLLRRQGRQSEADKHFTNMLWLLSAYDEDDVLPESDGLTAGRLMEMMRSTSLVRTPPAKISLTRQSL